MELEIITLAELVTRNFEARKSYLAENKIEAYRLITQNDFELPLAVDIYLDNAVVHVFGPLGTDDIKQLENALRTRLNIKDFFYKNRTKGELQLPLAKKKEIVVNEYGHKFHLNLSDYLDTGLFLDHRETRKWIKAQSKGKVVLNTFAYTGSFSIYAAVGGAEKTYSVDLSRTYTEWIKKNLELNNLPLEKNWTYKMDTFEFFNYARRKKLTFDIIIIDPPTFSRNKGESFSVKNDYPKLINAALELLTPKGFIVFSNNYTDFVMDEKKLKPCRVQEKLDTLPPDFQNSFAHWCYVISH